MQFKTLIILLIALAIVVPVASYGAYSYMQPKLTIIKQGDNVTLWYYGYIVIDGNPLVFDTNMASIANNNTSYPKAPDFKYHPPFTVLNDTVGSGSMIKGFDDGLIGMAKGESGFITVLPSQGYGLENKSLITRHPINGTVPMYQIMNNTSFKAEFGVYPVQGETLRSPAYGWNVYVMSYNGWFAEIENEPVVQGQYYPYSSVKGFSIVADSISGMGNSTTISYTTVAINGTILSNSSYVSGISGGYYYLNGNSYLVGKTLYFYVDIVTVKS
ncbi:MAG: FKBP-type peptidyl-prolyl cis-trans isomerase [Candidatus Thermoplasmatota archaeon]|jgi:FKBP-type peptidyl-prolyl cis-trans isomerase 2|nr:FKBP-type peptidyl-prolyl cis-trans isomerase [Candidatus Thermoplasmatota archaeon]MCL5789865.1 FKBP-type peptidyl-prolyl cis-trans isomerase [Candidatus Thermoplasmatota archaeon]